MANPVSVGGMRKLIAKVGDQVMDDLKRFANNTGKVDNPVFVSEASLIADGQFGFNKSGDFGLVANVITKGPVAADLDAQADVDWNSVGDGNLTITYKVSVTSRRKDAVE